MWVFVIGFVFVFVILKGKIINLKLLYEKSGKLFYFFLFFMIGFGLGHELGALLFRLGLKVA